MLLFLPKSKSELTLSPSAPSDPSRSDGSDYVLKLHLSNLSLELYSFMLIRIRTYFQNNFMSLQILPPDSMSRIIDKHFEFSQTLHFSIKESIESQKVYILFLEIIYFKQFT